MKGGSVPSVELMIVLRAELLVALPVVLRVVLLLALSVGGVVEVA